VGRLLGRDVDDGVTCSRQAVGCLKHERGLSGPRLAAEQDDAALDEAAAEHAVELADTGSQSGHVIGRRVGEVHGG